MSLADLTRAKRALHAVGKGEQTEGIGDAGAGAADALGDGRLRQPEIVDELAVGGRLLQRREVGAHDILDQRQLQHGARDGLLDDGGHRAQPRQTGRPPAPLPRDEDEPATLRTVGDHQRLDHPVHADRGGERLQRLRVHLDAGLIGIRRDRVDIDIERGRRPLAIGGDERVETTSQTAPS